jgi:hypothetical protein
MTNKKVIEFAILILVSVIVVLLATAVFEFRPAPWAGL